MRKLSYFIYLISTSTLATTPAPIPVNCPDQILCQTNLLSDCLVQGQFAPDWNNPTMAGTPLRKGIYSFDSVWIKFSNGFAMLDECYYVNKSAGTPHYVSVTNKGKPAYYVTLPLSSVWTVVPNKTETIKCESPNIYQCSMLMRGSK